MDSLLICLQSILDDIEYLEDMCIDRLIGSIEKRKGIISVAINKKKMPGTELSIKFNPDTISGDQIRVIVVETGKMLNKTFGHLCIKVKEIKTNHHAEAISNILKNVKGVINVLAVPTGIIMVEFNKYITQESVLRDLIEQMGIVI